MTHENNHEVTRVSFREEVERSLESTLPSTVPAKQKREAATRVEQILERYSSPYPDPQFLARIEQLAPGSAKDIVAATLKDLEHRRSIDTKKLELKSEEIGLIKGITSGEMASVRQGRFIGLAAYLACLLFSGTMFVLGSQTLALAGFGAAALGIITQLIRGGGSSGVMISAGPDEEESKKPSTEVATTGKSGNSKK